MIKGTYKWWLLSLLACLLTACEEDSYHYPSVKLEFLTAFLETDGSLKSILTDEGTVYPVVEDASGMKLQGSSSVRIVSNYASTTAANGTQGVKLYAAMSAISPVPLPPAKFANGVKTDPVELQSIWMGRDYLNLLVGIKAQNGRHLLHFIEDKVDVDAATGHATVYLRLYHDAAGDVPAYTSRAYASIPLWPYAKDGVRTVTVHFSLNTYSGETKNYKFDYKPNQTQKSN